MISLRKKPSLMCSAFLFAGLLSTLLVEQAAAEVSCSGNQFADSITRSEVSGINGAGAERVVALSNQQTGTLINQNVDLNIQVDVNSISSGQVIAEGVDWVWQLTAHNKDKLTGSIVANYQFDSVGGVGKICSGVNSCLSVLDVRTNVTYQRHPSGRVTLAEGRIILTLDLSQAVDAGSYQANLTTSLHHNSTANPSLCP